MTKLDAVVVGSGPNGLAAAIVLAREGLSVRVIEAADRPGGGMRTDELTVEGFKHDVCSAIHPLGLASPFFRELDLKKHGLEWIHPQAPAAHPLDAGDEVVLERTVDATAEQLGADAKTYKRVVGYLNDHAEHVIEELLRPIWVPHRVLLLARFGLHGASPLMSFARRNLKTTRAKALFAGLAAHSMLRLTQRPTAGFSMLLGMLAHHVGWPMAKGGTERITDALVEVLNSYGGTIETDHRVASLDELPDARVVMLDLTPRQVARICDRKLSERYLRKLRSFRYGPGVCKVDWALSEPAPWTGDGCRRAGTVHVCGTAEEVAASEEQVASGRHAEKPYVLFVQQSQFDSSRAPDGNHTAWAYCHVPNNSTEDVSDRIEAQIERFAPGFTDNILARNVRTARGYQLYNENYAGGDINGGAQDLRQHIARPVMGPNPYATPDRSIFICSSSTPPGGGVHGICGYKAARLALRREFGIRI